MRNLIVAVLSVMVCASFAFAKTDKKMTEKQKLIDKMVEDCKGDLSKDPALSDMTDGEVVWKNLEDKEHSGMKLAKKCDRAHEKYEHKYHKGEESYEKHEGTTKE